MKVYEFTITDDEGLPLEAVGDLADNMVHEESILQGWDFKYFWTSELPDKAPWNVYKFEVFKETRKE